MSSERNTPRGNGDEAVTRAYRHMATERVPEHLDRVVLRLASSAARPGYARARTWARPLAWAATIALSVGIVLELTRVPEQLPVDGGAPAAEDVSAIAPAASPAASGRSADVIQGAREKSTAMQKAAPPVAVESAGAAEKLEADAPASRPGSEARTDIVGREAVGLTDGNDFLRQQADEVLQESADGTARRFSATVQPAATAAGAEPAAAERGYCSGDAMRLPSTWLECIEELEKAGLVDEAARERRSLQEAFPGIELP